MSIEQNALITASIEAYIEELVRDQDRDAAFVTGYTREISGVGELCNAFPSLYGKDFFQWLQIFGERGDARILEFGGGVKQVAARTVLKTVPGIEQFVGYEIKQLNAEVKKDLSEFPQYKNIQGGLSEFDASLVGGDNFDVAFAHNVAEHLPHPFLLVKKMHTSLKKGSGLLFVNGINLYGEVAEDLFKQWQQRGYKFGYTYGVVDRNMKEADIVRVNIGFQRTSNEIHIPIPTGTPLMDFAGISYPTVVYQSPKKDYLKSNGAHWV